MDWTHWGRRRVFTKLRHYVLPAMQKSRLQWAGLLGLTTAALVILWTLYGRPKQPLTSAVGCKSKIAQIVIPYERDRTKYLEPMGVDLHQVEDDFYSFVERVTFTCSHQVTVGPEGEGGWEVCVDREFDFTSPCLVYSFGIGNDFRFEKEIEEKFQCNVHAFDPSMNMPSHQYSDRGHFYNIGLDNVNRITVDGRWKLQRLKTIMKELGHEGLESCALYQDREKCIWAFETNYYRRLSQVHYTTETPNVEIRRIVAEHIRRCDKLQKIIKSRERTIDYLKMDIEFSEWPALYDIIRSGAIHLVRQLAVEVHTPEMDKPWRPDNACTWCRWDTLRFMLRTLIDLHNAGMSLYYSRTNYRIEFKSAITRRHRYCCYNLHFVNTKFRKDRAHL